VILVSDELWVLVPCGPRRGIKAFKKSFVLLFVTAAKELFNAVNRPKSWMNFPDGIRYSKRSTEHIRHQQ
jgi:hypothetical protein